MYILTVYLCELGHKEYFSKIFHFSLFQIKNERCSNGTDLHKFDVKSMIFKCAF